MNRDDEYQRVLTDTQVRINDCFTSINAAQVEVRQLPGHEGSARFALHELTGAVIHLVEAVSALATAIELAVPHAE